MNILYIDDDDIGCRLGRRILELLGHTVQCAVSLTDADAALSREKFDCIICDGTLNRSTPNDGVRYATKLYDKGYKIVVYSSDTREVPRRVFSLSKNDLFDSVEDKYRRLLALCEREVPKARPVHLLLIVRDPDVKRLFIQIVGDLGWKLTSVIDFQLGECVLLEDPVDLVIGDYPLLESKDAELWAKQLMANGVVVRAMKENPREGSPAISKTAAFASLGYLPRALRRLAAEIPANKAMQTK